MIEYVNLTRGLECTRDGHCHPSLYRVCRVQSSQCEAKAWDDVLWSVPDEMLFWAAQGQYIVVHDRSERDRETRACWQGLELARIYAERVWLGYHWPLEGRGNGNGMEHYFTNYVFSSLARNTRQRFRFYAQYLNPGVRSVRITSCRRASQQPEWPELKAIQETLKI